MMKKIQQYAKYKILRHRVGTNPIKSFTLEELEIMNFVNSTLRTSESITISSSIVKVIKGNLQISMEKGRLRAVDNVRNYVMDVRLNDLMVESIKDYAKRIVKHRANLFNKSCSFQISNLIDEFQK